MSRRKDRERFQRLKEQNPNYAGFRGQSAVTQSPPASLESAVCSVCGRKRNVPADTLPEDRASFVCLTCQQEQASGNPSAG